MRMKIINLILHLEKLLASEETAISEQVIVAAISQCHLPTLISQPTPLMVILEIIHI